MKNTISKLVLGLLIGLALAFGFTFLFMRLASRPVLDQALLLLVSIGSFSYLSFSILNATWPTRESLRSQSIYPDRTRLGPFFIKNLPGLGLAVAFFAIYLFIALKLNHPHIDTVDNFL